MIPRQTKKLRNFLPSFSNPSPSSLCANPHTSLCANPHTCAASQSQLLHTCANLHTSCLYYKSTLSPAASQPQLPLLQVYQPQLPVLSLCVSRSSQLVPQPLLYHACPYVSAVIKVNQISAVSYRLSASVSLSLCCHVLLYHSSPFSKSQLSVIKSLPFSKCLLSAILRHPYVSTLTSYRSASVSHQPSPCLCTLSVSVSPTANCTPLRVIAFCISPMSLVAYSVFHLQFPSVINTFLCSISPSLSSFNLHRSPLSVSCPLL